jgi:hypothetical protein
MSVNHSEVHRDIEIDDIVYSISPYYWRDPEVLGPWHVDTKSPSGRIKLVGDRGYRDTVYYKTKLEALQEYERRGLRRIADANDSLAAATAFVEMVRKKMETET